MNKRMNKKGQGGAFLLGLFFVVVAGGGLLFWGNNAGWFDGKLSIAGEKATGVSCESSTTPNFSVNAYDAENVGTAITEATNSYRETGTKTWSTFTGGTGFAVGVGKNYEIVMGVTTADQIDNAYGPYFKSGPIACEETPSIEKAVYNDEVDSSVSATFFNADGVASTAETFSAGQTQTVSLKFLAGSDEVYGNPTIPGSGVTGTTGGRDAYPNVYCMDLNSTSWDKPEKVMFDGVEMRQVSQPTLHSGVTSHTTYCYEAPVVNDVLMEQNRYQLRVNADDAVAATDDDTGYLYTAHFFIDADDGDVKWGVEDENGDAVGSDGADSVTLDWT